MSAFVPVRNSTAHGSILKRCGQKMKFQGKGTSKMKVKCRSWVSAFALLGLVSASMSGKSADAQQEVTAFAVAADFSLTTGIATDPAGDISEGKREDLI